MPENPENKEVEEDYKNALSDLTVNSKPMITMLTMLAEENKDYARVIVKVLFDHINETQHKLPAMYLIDSIVKNVGTEYIRLFSNVLVQLFSIVFRNAEEKTRKKLYELRQTWNEVFPQSRLYLLDVKINEVDPAWPITSQPRGAANQALNIHINPKKIKQVPAPFQPSGMVAPAQSTSTSSSSSIQTVANQDIEELRKIQIEKKILEEKRKTVEKQMKQEAKTGESSEKPQSETSSSAHSNRRDLLRNYKIKKKSHPPDKQQATPAPTSHPPPTNKEKGGTIHVAPWKARMMFPAHQEIPKESRFPSTQPVRDPPINRDPRLAQQSLKVGSAKPTSAPRDPRVISKVPSSVSAPSHNHPKAPSHPTQRPDPRLAAQEAKKYEQYSHHSHHAKIASKSCSSNNGVVSHDSNKLNHSRSKEAPHVRKTKNKPKERKESSQIEKNKKGVAKTKESDKHSSNERPAAKEKDPEKIKCVPKSKEKEKTIETDKLREKAKEKEKVKDVDMSKEKEKTIEMDKLREKSKEREKPKEKVKDVDMSKEKEKTIETDKPREKSKEREKPKEKVKDVDKSKEKEKITETDKPREKPKEKDNVKDVKSKDKEKTIETDKPREKSKEREKPKEKEKDEVKGTDKSKEKELVKEKIKEHWSMEKPSHKSDKDSSSTQNSCALPITSGDTDLRQLSAPNKIISRAEEDKIESGPMVDLFGKGDVDLRMLGPPPPPSSASNDAREPQYQDSSKCAGKINHSPKWFSFTQRPSGSGPPSFIAPPMQPSLDPVFPSVMQPPISLAAPMTNVLPPQIPAHPNITPGSYLSTGHIFPPPNTSLPPPPLPHFSGGKAISVPPPGPIRAPPPSLPPPIDIHSLLGELTKSGLIGNKKDQTKESPDKPKSPKKSEAAPPEEEEIDDLKDFPPLLEMFNLENLRKRNPKLIIRLYRGLQCSSCGLRYPSEQTAHYSHHLDWHFRMNKKQQESSKKPNSRKYYLCIDDWLKYEEIEDLDERVSSMFEDEENGVAKDLNQIESEDEVIPSVAVSADHSLSVCPVCHETFDQFYHHNTEEWHYKYAIVVDGINYHPPCHQDLLKSLKQEEEKKQKELEEKERKQREEEEEKSIEKKKEELAGGDAALPAEQEVKGVEESDEVIVEEKRTPEDEDDDIKIEETKKEEKVYETIRIDDEEDDEGHTSDDDDEPRSRKDSSSSSEKSNEEESSSSASQDSMSDRMSSMKLIPEAYVPVRIKEEPTEGGTEMRVYVPRPIPPILADIPIKMEIEDEEAVPPTFEIEDDEAATNNPDQADEEHPASWLTSVPSTTAETDIASSIDGNTEFISTPENSQPTTVVPKIKISVSVPLRSANENEEKNSEMNGTVLNSTAEENHIDDFVPPPFTVDLALKHAFEGVELLEQPVEHRGAEISSLCSIM